MYFVAYFPQYTQTHLSRIVYIRHNTRCTTAIASSWFWLLLFQKWSRLANMNFFHFWTFSLGKVTGQQFYEDSIYHTQTAISDSPSGSIPRRVQVRSMMKSRHLVQQDLSSNRGRSDTSFNIFRISQLLTLPWVSHRKLSA